MYHENPRINAVLLVAINDGDGSQCGRSYAERCELARRGNRLFEFRWIARECARREGIRWHDRQEWADAGDFLQRYYEEHVREMDEDPEQQEFVISG